MLSSAEGVCIRRRIQRFLTNMEGVEMEFHLPENADVSSDDFCNTVLSQFSSSNNEHHVHICTAIGTMSQELKDQNLPLTPITYFGATCSSLQCLYTSSPEGPPSHLIDALSTILSLVLPRINKAILKQKYEYLSNLMTQLLGLKTIGIEGIIGCLKCVMHLLIVGSKGNWSDVAQLYGVFICYLTDDRQKVATFLLSFNNFNKKLDYFCSFGLVHAFLLVNLSSASLTIWKLQMLEEHKLCVLTLQVILYTNIDW